MLVVLSDFPVYAVSRIQSQTTKGGNFFKSINTTSEMSLVASKCENIY